MKLFVIKRNTILLFIAMVTFVLSLSTLTRNNAILVFNPNKLLPIYSVEREDKKISLTFDSAWGDEDIPQLIEVLDEYNVKASFFILGEWVDKYPESVKALADAGHEVLNHSDTHPHMNKMNIEQLREEIKACDDKIFNLTGQKHNLFRAPYGEYNDNVILAAQSVGNLVIQWDVDSLDWKDPSPEQMMDNVTKKVRSGSIMLFHSGTKNTLSALPAIIEKLQREGYELVPVSNLVYREGFTLDHTGRQIKNSD